VPETDISISSDKHLCEQTCGTDGSLAMGRLVGRAKGRSLNNAIVEERLGSPKPLRIIRPQNGLSQEESG